jgi:hypothetical protein
MALFLKGLIMKKLFIVIFLGMFSVTSIGAQTQVDLERIGTGHIYDIKSISQQYYKMDPPSSEVLDALAEFLWVNYPNMLAKHADAYAWICNALSKDKQGRYITLLNEINNSSTHKKLKKYARKALKIQKKNKKKALKKNTALEIALYQKGTTNLDDLKALSKNKMVIKSGLTDKQQDIFHILDFSIVPFRNTIQKYYHNQSNDTEVLDVIAEVLYQKYPTSTDYDADALAWACKTLAASKNKRYFALIKEISTSNSHKKVVKHAKKSLKLFKNNSDERYKKGMVDLDKLFLEVAEVPSNG